MVITAAHLSPIITDHCPHRGYPDPGYAKIVELRRRLLPYCRGAYWAERHLSFHSLTSRTPALPIAGALCKLPKQ